MSIEEFLETKWCAGMKVEILSGVLKGKVFAVASPDFDQQLIGCFCNPFDDEPTWFRCENCKLV